MVGCGHPLRQQVGTEECHSPSLFCCRSLSRWTRSRTSPSPSQVGCDCYSIKVFLMVPILPHPFHCHASLPAAHPSSGRSEMAKAAKGDECEVAVTAPTSTRKSICNFFTRARDWTRDLILGPPTSLDDCMNVFFDTCDLQNDNKYFCENCNRFG